MTFDEFKTDALRTESKLEALNFSTAGLFMLMDACVQMAKIVDTAKKTMFYGKPLDEGKFRNSVAVLRDSLQRLEQRNNLATPDDTASTLHTPNLRLAHGTIGMFGEAGEMIEAMKKFMVTGELDLINLAEEAGDSDWYKTIIHDETGVSEDECRAKVIAKLKARYGDKFSNEAALNRDLVAERAVLEATAG